MTPRPAINPPTTVMGAYFITHMDDWDTLLVRIGHHLWKWRKYAIKHRALAELEVLDMALEDVWRVKREYRKPIKEAEQARLKAAGERLSALRRGQ